jgi:predicted amidohydrolase
MVITLYQQDILWAQPDENRRRVEQTLAETECDLFVVPETFTTGFGDHMASLAEPPEGPTLQWARQMAARHNLLFVGTWIVQEGGHCYNRLHWVYPDGTYGHYDKGHTFRVSGEADQISRGTERKVFEFKGWRIKPAVCYDLRFPKWLRNDNMDYDLLLVCANWPGSRHEAWTTLLRARAIENLCYTVGCNRSGTDGADIPYSGNSAIVDYKGFPLHEATGEQCITATLDKKKLDIFRQHWPLYLDFD